MNTPSRSHRRRGFTMVEVLIAGSLAAVIAGTAIYFVVQGTRASLRTASSTENDLVQWSISSRLGLDSRVANGAVLYLDTNATNITIANRRVGGQRGNLLVLSSSRNPDGSRSSSFQHLTGYWYDPTDRTLYRFTHVVSDAEQKSGASLESIINTNMDAFEFVEIADNVDMVVPGGLFVSRDVGNINAAAATIRLNEGSKTLATLDQALVEVSFMIRN